MKLHLLGINGPFPERNGLTSGYLLESGGSLFQFDLGSGTLGALTARTAPESLDALFLSHWHFDHTADVPVLMYRLQALGKNLPVFGPADPSSSMYRLVSSADCFVFTEISPGQVLNLGRSEIRINHARHPVPAVGFRVTADERIFGYTGDTNTVPGLAGEYMNCHLLLADGLFPADAWSEEKPHLSARLAASLASDAKADRLIITHLNPLIPLRPLLDEARSVHPRTQLAQAGASVEV